MRVYVLQYRGVVVAGRYDRIIGVFDNEAAAYKRIEEICAMPDTRRAFAQACGWPYAERCTSQNFTIEPFELQRD